MGDDARPALQVIVLGAGGGPQESNVTAFLVRSVAQDWRRGSIVAVDAGVHLSAITRLIKEASAQLPSDTRTLTTGPFAGFTLPHASDDANAAYITGSLVDTFLITHPHLDHISGFVINTAGLPSARPKKLAGLPSTIQAFKNHIFNNVIWPNLSDENNGAGLLTYLRLVEGGSPALGDGEGRGYLEVCDGLLVKTWSVSHGHCIEQHSHRGSVAGTRFGSMDASFRAGRKQSLLSQATFGAVAAMPEENHFCVYDSSAYFIQDHDHRKEVLMFGDVEPDSISLSPRNLLIWQEAAPKIAAGTLAAVFIECSYDDSQSEDRLFGHLKPVYVVEELSALAAEVSAVRGATPGLRSKKRKRTLGTGEARVPTPAPTEEPVSPRTIKSDPLDAEPTTPHLSTPTDELSIREMDAPSPAEEKPPLEGLTVVIIHVKERLMDGPDVKESILAQLQAHGREAGLGCDFVIARSGQSFYF